jgi:hypothetical protein
MPLVIAPLFGSLLGVLLAWLGRLGLRRHSGPVLTSQAFAIVSLFSLCVELPCFAHVAFLHGDWGYMYFAPWSNIPSAVDASLAFGAALTTPLTFLFASRAAMGARFDLLFRAILGLVGVLLLSVLFGFRRLTTVASYAQFHGEFGVKGLARTGVGAAATSGSIVLSWLAIAAGLFVCVRKLRDAAREQ